MKEKSEGIKKHESTGYQLGKFVAEIHSVFYGGRRRENDRIRAGRTRRQR